MYSTVSACALPIGCKDMRICRQRPAFRSKTLPRSSEHYKPQDKHRNLRAHAPVTDGLELLTYVCKAELWGAYELESLCLFV